VDKFDRIFQLHAILVSRRTPVPLEQLEAKLECSKSTVLRAISTMKDYLGAPIEFDRDAGGYKYGRPEDGEAYELPGLWFTANELQALAIMRRLVKDAGGGLLEEHLGALAKRLDDLTKHQHLNLGEAAQRLRFPAVAARPAGASFNAVASATLKRRKLWLEYHARSTNQVTERTVSPQRIVHYREAWYLDAWDEGKDALRSFSIDRIRRATATDDRALDVPETELDDHYSTAYGIFGGKADKVAVLRFTPERARWVADEQWHPQQEGTWLSDGSYELQVPYREAHELVMDIMRQGAGVKVVGPEKLRQEIAAQLHFAADQYGSTL
jgi:predicted DNA-binding transcriptional regulator YafY